MKTTLNKIKKHNPCLSSWDKLLNHLGKKEADDEKVELSVILNLLGIRNAIWALRSLDNNADKDIRLFACDCAESVLYIYENIFRNDDRPRKSIEVARQYANGKATLEDLQSSSKAARASAAYAAAYAVTDVAAERKKQTQFYKKYFC